MTTLTGIIGFSHDLLLDHSDRWVRRTTLAALVRQPQTSDRRFFEDLLSDDDPVVSYLAFLALRNLFPAPASMSDTWRDLFGESIDLLSRRATQGPLALRSAALQALTFAPGGLQPGLTDRLLRFLHDHPSGPALSWSVAPSLPLVNQEQALDPVEGLAFLLLGLPPGADSISLLQRELSGRNPERLLPVFIALQLRPVPELCDALLPHIRTSAARPAIEAVRALAVCGGPRMFPLLSSLLRETSQIERKGMLLAIIAQTGRDEAWPILCDHTRHDHSLIRRRSVIAMDHFPASTEEKRAVLLPLLDDRAASVAMPAAVQLWQLGHVEAIAAMEHAFQHGRPEERREAAVALGALPAEIAVPPLLERMTRERNGNVMRAMVLALRRRLPALQPRPNLIDQMLPLLRCLLSHSDDFLRCQAAVLCGTLGASAEDLILEHLLTAEHPHVLAALIAAIGRVGSHRLLVLARFHDHPDARVRANLMQSLLFSGTQAIPYLTRGLQDSAARVRADAARSLFLLGQLEVVAELNRMLLIPAPLPILAGCHALGHLMRIQPPGMTASHPLALALERRNQRRRAGIDCAGPPLLDGAEVPPLLRELAIARGEPRKSIWILDEYRRRVPNSHVARRLAVSFLIAVENYPEALTAIEACLEQHPSILADLLDAYRLALLTGNLDRAKTLGERVTSAYSALHQACLEMAKQVRGPGAEAFIDKIYHLASPSMNLYNAMIQLKARQGETTVVLDLLAELFLARPTAAIIARQLAGTLPDTAQELQSAVQTFAAAIEEFP